MIECIRCNGKGVLSISLGAPDPTRDTHAPYLGAWYTFPPVTCAPCGGRGVRRDRFNQQAGWRIHLNGDGHLVRKERL